MGEEDNNAATSNNEVTDSGGEVELVIQDGENLLVIDNDPGRVERYLRKHGLLERARALTSQQLVPMLNAAATGADKLAAIVTESGRWVKLTEESAHVKATLGLIDGPSKGVSYLLAGDRGPGGIKRWLQADTSAGAKITNPGLLSGLAGALTQAAAQAEAAQLRTLMSSMNEKLDGLRQDNIADLLGDLDGIEDHLRDVAELTATNGDVGIQDWTTIAAIPKELKQLRSKVSRRLAAAAHRMQQHKLSDFKSKLPEDEAEIRLWLQTIVRIHTALDDYAVLYLSHTALTAPDQLDAKRLHFQRAREGALDKLVDDVTMLMNQMSEAEARANENRIPVGKQMPKIMRAINQTRETARELSAAFDQDLEWEELPDPGRMAALVHPKQLKNAVKYGGSKMKDNSGTILGVAGLLALWGAQQAINGKNNSPGTNPPPSV